MDQVFMTRHVTEKAYEKILIHTNSTVTWKKAYDSVNRRTCIAMMYEFGMTYKLVRLTHDTN